MIVSEKNVSDALAYLAQGGAAEAEAAFLAAEQRKDRLYAKLYLAAKGTIDERKAAVIDNEEYQSALTDEIGAKFQFSRAKSRASGADKMCEIWRTEQSNIRAAEKIR